MRWPRQSADPPGQSCPQGDVEEWSVGDMPELVSLRIVVYFDRIVLKVGCPDQADARDVMQFSSDPALDSRKLVCASPCQPSPVASPGRGRGLVGPPSG